MVHVCSNTLSISPVDPYTTDSIRVTAWIKGDAFNLYCPGGSPNPITGFTRTNIHLLRRNVGAGQSRLQADHVATYDCYTRCCLDNNTAREIPGHPGEHGWQIGFDLTNPITTPGTYEFFAVDEEDYNKTNYANDRIGARTVVVVRDPTLPVVTPPTTETPDSSDSGCEEGDILCEYKDYIPYIAIGVVLLLVVMGGKRR